MAKNEPIIMWRETDGVRCGLNCSYLKRMLYCWRCNHYDITLVLKNDVPLRGPNCLETPSAERLLAKSSEMEKPHQKLTTEEAAEYLRIKPATLEVWRCRGKGPKYQKIGRRVIYDQADLDDFANAGTVLTTDTCPTLQRGRIT